MWIALSILALLAALITVIWLLPVKVLVYNDENNELNLRYRFLFKTYGEDPDPNAPIIKMLKKAGGVDRLKKNVTRKNIQTAGVRQTVTESYTILMDLLREIVALLKVCTVTRLRVTIRSAGEDAAEAAIHYGQYCAATHGLLASLRSLLKVRNRGCQIDIGCDYAARKEIFRYDAVLLVRFGRVLVSFWHIAMEEARRMAAEKQNQQK